MVVCTFFYLFRCTITAIFSAFFCPLTGVDHMLHYCNGMCKWPSWVIVTFFWYKYHYPWVKIWLSALLCQRIYNSLFLGGEVYGHLMWHDCFLVIWEQERWQYQDSCSYWNTLMWKGWQYWAAVSQVTPAVVVVRSNLVAAYWHR